MKRLTLSLLIVIVLSVISLGWAIDQWYNHYADNHEDPAISAYKKMGKEIALYLDQFPTTMDTSQYTQLTPQIQTYDQFPLPEDMAIEFKQGNALLLDSDQQLTLHFYLPNHNSVLSFVLPKELQQESSNIIRWILTVIFYFGVTLMVLVWLYPLLKRLIHLQSITQAFGNGDLQARVNTDKKSYINSIEQEFNRMAQRIEQLITDNKLLSRSLSHDLRTPLARLRFGIDVLQEGELPLDQQHHLAHINRDLMAMESLVEAMLEYSKLDSAALKLKWQSLDIVQFTRDFVDHLQNPIIQFITEKNSASLLADPFYLHSLLQNLTDNAIKNAKNIILIGITQKEDELILTIEDDGKGIADNEKEKVFQPFYRAADNENSGYGLGLSIANRIVIWHKGKIHIENSDKLGGAKIVITFYILK